MALNLLTIPLGNLNSQPNKHVCDKSKTGVTRRRKACGSAQAETRVPELL